jgi:uncharacterized protein (DUF608 family)
MSPGADLSASPPVADDAEIMAQLKASAGGRTEVVKKFAAGFPGVLTTRGEPRVRYRDPELPLAVELEASSPFVPLDLESSSYPATILRFTLVNTSGRSVDGELAGWLENAVCHESRARRTGRLRNRILSSAEPHGVETGPSGPIPRSPLLHSHRKRDRLPMAQP